MTIRRGWTTTLFVVLAAIVALAYACVAWQQLRYGLEYDESYNLTVAKNLAQGRGYVTTGISYGWLVPFDPAASTGPALVLPGAAVWWATGGTLWAVRIVPIVLFAVYLAGLWWIFSPVAGRFAALLAVASPLVLSVSKEDISTVSLVPGRYVGEFAAVAFVVLMAVLLSRDHPFLAGLAGGLAIQTKVNFLLPLAVVVAAWLLGGWLRRDSHRAKAAIYALLGLCVPTAVFELYRLSQVGFSGYLPNLKANVAWMIAYGEQDKGDFLASAGRRLAGLAETLSPLGALLIVLALALLVLLAFVTLVRTPTSLRSDAVSGNPRHLDAIVGLLGAAVVMLIWWALIPPEKLPRIGLPIILLGVPVLAVGAYVALADAVVRSGGRPRLFLTTVSGVLTIGVVLLTASQGFLALRNDFGHRMLDEQHAAAAAITASGTPSLPIYWIWNLAQFQILTGLPSDTKPAVAPATVKVFDSIRARSDKGVDDARAFLDECASVLYASQSAVVCR